MKMGVYRIITGRARREPYNVSMNAEWARPLSMNWWPGRMDRKESSSGAPR